MTNPDAYAYDDGFDTVIVEPNTCPNCGSQSPYRGTVAWCDCTGWLEGTFTPLELVASFDHGLRTADETAVAIGTECVAQVCQAFYRAALVPFDSSLINWDAAMLAAELITPAVDDRSGLGWCENVDDSQALYEWQQYEAEPMFWHAGGIVETSADAGMTWLYVPMARD